MKALFTFCMVLLFSLSLQAQTKNPQYDSTLAQSLGADDYGMKTYVLVILKSGANKDTSIIDSCFKGHMDNMDKMVQEGKLVVAGPMGRNAKSYRGIFILNMKDLEAAKLLLDTDPAIHSGFLEPELFVWYGSAALPMYLDASDKIWKEKP